MISRELYLSYYFNSTFFNCYNLPRAKIAVYLSFIPRKIYVSSIILDPVGEQWTKQTKVSVTMEIVF